MSPASFPVLILTLATIGFAGATVLALRWWRQPVFRSAACFAAVNGAWCAALAVHLSNPQAGLPAQAVVILFHLAMAAAYWLVAQRAQQMKDLPHVIARVGTLSFWLLLWPVSDGTIPPAAAEQAFPALASLPGGGWMLLLFALGLIVAALTLMVLLLRDQRLFNAGVILPCAGLWLSVFVPGLTVVSAVLLLAGAGLLIYNLMNGPTIPAEKEQDIPLAKMVTVETPRLSDPTE